MKRSYLITISVLLLLFSCKKENNAPFTENITKGEKWGIRIGSSAADVYTQLQQTGIEKSFNSVAIVYRPYFSKPEQVQQLLPFYNAVTLSNKAGIVERAVIQLTKIKLPL